MQWLLCLAGLLLLVGCEPTEAERYRQCVDLFERNEPVYDVVSVATWRVGPLPFLTTSKAVRAVLGEPDKAQSPAPEIQWLYYEQPTSTYTVLAESLAYPTYLDLSSDTLATEVGVFSKRTTLSDARRAYPQSYRCREFTLNEYGDQYETQLIVSDTTRKAEVALWFQGDRLAAVGVYHYRPGRVLVNSGE